MTTTPGLGPTAMKKAIERARRLDAGARSAIGPLLVSAYRFGPLRYAAQALAKRAEGGLFFSKTLREIVRVHHGVEVGSYSYGWSVEPGHFPPGSTIGNYCSFGSVRRVEFGAPADRIAQHPIFHDPRLGLVDADPPGRASGNPLSIGHDVYAGRDVWFSPGCRKVGDGAVIGASSVLTEDVPAYTLIAGNPAKVIRKRYSDEVEEAIRLSEWYLQPISVLVEQLDDFINPASLEMLERLIGRLGAGREETG